MRLTAEAEKVGMSPRVWRKPRTVSQKLEAQGAEQRPGSDHSDGMKAEGSVDRDFSPQGDESRRSFGSNDADLEIEEDNGSGSERF